MAEVRDLCSAYIAQVDKDGETLRAHVDPRFREVSLPAFSELIKMRDATVQKLFNFMSHVGEFSSDFKEINRKRKELWAKIDAIPPVPKMRANTAAMLDRLRTVRYQPGTVDELHQAHYDETVSYLEVALAHMDAATAVRQSLVDFFNSISAEFTELAEFADTVCKASKMGHKDLPALAALLKRYQDASSNIVRTAPTINMRPFAPRARKAADAKSAAPAIAAAAPVKDVPAPVPSSSAAGQQQAARVGVTTVTRTAPDKEQMYDAKAVIGTAGVGKTHSPRGTAVPGAGVAAPQPVPPKSAAPQQFAAPAGQPQPTRPAPLPPAAAPTQARPPQPPAGAPQAQGPRPPAGQPPAYVVASAPPPVSFQQLQQAAAQQFQQQQLQQQAQQQAQAAIRQAQQQAQRQPQPQAAGAPGAYPPGTQFVFVPNASGYSPALYAPGSVAAPQPLVQSQVQHTPPAVVRAF